MELRKQIKAERDKQRAHLPFRRRLFDRVNAIVKRHALGEAFLANLANFSNDHLREYLAVYRLRAKDHRDPPLFSLSTEEEYRVTIAILNAANNPYLHFASSPEEILLSRPLFDLNPSLEPDKLTRCDFATLLREIGGAMDGT